MYGRSKLEAEQRILDIHPNPLIVRTTVVYGFDAQRKNFLYSLYRILKSDQTMRVPSDQVSTPTNNMDLAKATIKLIDLGVSGVVHVSGSELLSRYDFALEAAKILHLDGSLIQPVATHQLMQKAPRPLHAGLKTDKLQTLLGSNTMRPVGEAVQEWAYDLTRSESV
jgi:dTDP-4-dehydrorhamnose reductase